MEVAIDHFGQQVAEFPTTRPTAVRKLGETQLAGRVDATCRTLTLNFENPVTQYKGISMTSSSTRAFTVLTRIAADGTPRYLFFPADTNPDFCS
ncbi:hypothetical protein [Frigoribacterium sp. UYMn621]|uniref:hypothetical protein n=1 Tax=Frigoribacterium sp. UYMn621 TaxID=3156343 RepID=UPI00339399DF